MMDSSSELAQHFIRSINDGDVAQVDRLLSQNEALRASINETWFPFDAPAIVAAKTNHQMVEMLLKHGADINRRSDWWAGGYGVLDGVDRETADFLIGLGATLDIHAAAELGRVADVRQLLEQDPTLVNARGGDGATPLHVASTIEVTEVLLNHGADVSIRCLDHSATAAQYAIDDPKKCRRLLTAGASPDLFMAVALNDLELVDGILASEPDAVSKRTGNCPHTRPIHPRAAAHIYFWKLKNAETVFEVAAETGNPQLMQSLLDRAPDKDRFLAACWAGEQTQVKQVLLNTPDVFSQLDAHEQNELARAAWQGQLAAVEVMLDAGFDPHRPGPENSTPIDRAAFHGFHEVIARLLEKDPSPPLEFKNRFGGTPLSCCIWGSVHSWMKNDPRSNHTASVKSLLRSGATFDKSWLPTVNPEMDEILKKHAT